MLNLELTKYVMGDNTVISSIT